MTEPERSKTGDSAEEPEPLTLRPGEEAAVRAEDAYDEAQSAREASDEAEALNAAPYERLKKDGDA